MQRRDGGDHRSTVDNIQSEKRPTGTPEAAARPTRADHE
jgi:hypothetical protein